MEEYQKKFIPSEEIQNRCNIWVKSQAELCNTSEQSLKRQLEFEQEDCLDTDSEFDSVSECGAKRRRLATQVKSEILSLLCKWTDCSFQTGTTDKFVRHVAGHIPQLGIKTAEDDSEVYVCLWKDCAYESNSSEDISRHVNYHSYHTKIQSIGSNIRGRIKLPKCLRVIPLKTIFNLTSSHICQWENCTKTFTNYQWYLYHMHQHMNDNPRGNKVEGGVICRWTACKKKFPSIYKLREHMRRHTKEKTCACPDCGITFASNTKFHDHCRRQIPIDVQGFQCSYCNKFYPTENILRDHMRVHVFNYKCTLCDMSCGSPADLVKHIRYRHVSARPFPCQLCPHAAKSQQDLDSHMTVHTSGPNFICNYEGCSYTCKNAYVFDRHIERAHTDEERWYCCHECPIKYRKSYTLTKHLIEAHHLQANGHKRFQYMRDDDGYYRLQMVRYEAIDDDSPPPAEESSKNYKIKMIDVSSSFPQLEIVEDNSEEEDNGTASETRSEPEYPIGGKSMPIISNILISIDEMDADGNIIESKVVQTQETSELPPSEEPPIILT